ncbi:lipocalin, partial [Vibrio vulnificus]|nr:lipocalin [Vibrio vulnificus]
MRKILLLALSMTLTGCLGMPETVKPVDEF